MARASLTISFIRLLFIPPLQSHTALNKKKNQAHTPQPTFTLPSKPLTASEKGSIPSSTSNPKPWQSHVLQSPLMFRVKPTILLNHYKHSFPTDMQKLNSRNSKYSSLNPSFSIWRAVIILLEAKISFLNSAGKLTMVAHTALCQTAL